MNGDVQVRFRERLGGRFPGATRLLPKPHFLQRGFENNMLLIRDFFGFILQAFLPF